MITIKDIARHAKVSSATVSRVLNNSSPVNETKRMAVLEAMRVLNFQPNMMARGLASGESKTIGIAVQIAGSSFYNQVTDGISETLAELGYSPIFSNRKHMPGVGLEAVKTLLSRKIDGLILVGGEMLDADVEDIRNRVPTIVVGRDLSGTPGETVFVDNLQPAYELTKFLINAGHQRIAHIAGNQRHFDGRQRLQGYKQALQDFGIKFDPDCVYEGDFSAQCGVLGINALLSRGVHFSAVFAGNDLTAMGARLALYKQGIRVPEDISLVGFDDQAESSYMTPPLTTVRQPAKKIGFAAGRAVVSLIQGTPVEIPTLTAEVVFRDSVSRRI